MKSDLNDLKKLTMELMQNGVTKVQETNSHLINQISGPNDEDSEIDFEEEAEDEPRTGLIAATTNEKNYQEQDDNYQFTETVEEEEILKLEQREIEMIKKSLEKNRGKRKAAADELGISERTLYRKIKQFDL